MPVASGITHILSSSLRLQAALVLPSGFQAPTASVPLFLAKGPINLMRKAAWLVIEPGVVQTHRHHSPFNLGQVPGLRVDAPQALEAFL